MRTTNIEKEIKQPLVYIFMMFILASISYETYLTKKVLAITIVSAFFIIFFLYKKLFITIIFSGFYIIAILNNIFYYDYIPEINKEIRITKVSKYEVLGVSEGRNIILNIENNEVREGERLLIKGEFIKERNVKLGTVGEYKVESYEKLKDDVKCKLYRKREEVFNSISEKLGIRKASLITAMAFGYKQELDSYDSDELREIGVSHAIAVSGLHMGLIYGVVSSILGWKIGLVIGFIYMIFTGASPSTIRAYLMIFIMTFGKVTKRNYSQLSSLALAGVILLFYKPYIVKELGFMLSFLATLGIILFNKMINKSLYKLPEYLRNSISISLSTQIFTFPILVLYFNEFSIVFLLGNLIILPFMLMIVVLGNIVLIFNKVQFLFQYLLFICNYIIEIIDWILYRFDIIGFKVIYFNYIVVYLYISFLIAYYFYKKGYKRSIYFPVIFSIYIIVLIYSPVLNIQYYKEGALLVTYKGERVVLQTRQDVNVEKIKDICLSDNIKKNISRIRISNGVTIENIDNKYILNNNGMKYFLKVDYNKYNSKYDIIDFIGSDIQKVTVFKDNIIIR